MNKKRNKFCSWHLTSVIIKKKPKNYWKKSAAITKIHSCVGIRDKTDDNSDNLVYAIHGSNKTNV